MRPFRHNNFGSEAYRLAALPRSTMSSTSSHPRALPAAALVAAVQAESAPSVKKWRPTSTPPAPVLSSSTMSSTSSRQRTSVKKGVSFVVSTAPERSTLSSNRGSARSGRSRRGSAAAAPDKLERCCWSFLAICRFMVRVRRLSVLKDAPVEPEERHKYWRVLHASSHQEKLCRSGGILGANKGAFQPRVLVLHSKSLAYQDEDGTRVRSIGFADVVKVQRLKAPRQPTRVGRGVAMPAAGAVRAQQPPRLGPAAVALLGPLLRVPRRAVEAKGTGVAAVLERPLHGDARAPLRGQPLLRPPRLRLGALPLRPTRGR